MADDSALTFCAEQVRVHDDDRFLCALFAPEPARKGLLALYAFNLEIAKIREIVSEPMPGRIRLQWWREAIAGIYAGTPPRHEVAAALCHAVERFGLTRAQFDRLIDGREFDLDDAPPQDLGALEAYAEATSATLNALALEVLGARGAAAHAAGRHVGIAWALVGHLRAAAFHARAGRTFLPADLLKSAGLTPEDVFALEPSALKPLKALGRVAAEIADAARRHLLEARKSRAEIPREALPALLCGALAEAYLGRIRRAGYNLFAPNLGIAKPARQIRLALSALRGRF